MKRQRNRKTPDVTGMISEIMKTALLVHMSQIKYRLYEYNKMVWEDKSVPTHWLRALSCTTWKKEKYPRENLDNHRGVSLLSWTNKVLDVYTAQTI